VTENEADRAGLEMAERMAGIATLKIVAGMEAQAGPACAITLFIFRQNP
jgi:hypothetical protein